jgi:hypothetical protein
MAWRNPETLKIYENYFKSIGHYNVQDKVHEILEKEVKFYVKRQSNDEKPKDQFDGTCPQTTESDANVESRGSKKEPSQSSGWEKLLALGGAQ